MNLSILYRGPLSSCNYACDYCPFAKRIETAAELAHDRECLDRFVSWVGTRTSGALGILFTPWGEALVRWWYQDALAALNGQTVTSVETIGTTLVISFDNYELSIDEVANANTSGSPWYIGATANRPRPPDVTGGADDRVG